MVDATDRIPTPYGAAEPYIGDADLLLFRGSGLISHLIAKAGRGHYSHAALAVWARSTLLCCESREWKGARAVTLKSQVERFPGQIDVYKVRTPTTFDAVAAADFMLKSAGADYGYGAVIGAGLRHFPFVRLFAEPDTSDEALAVGPPFCSQLVAMAARKGGKDPVPNLADRVTEPSDLARSWLWIYHMTLVP